jgi:PPOX class probable F420-dependent enzyme
MTSLPDSARAVLESPALAHLVTLNPDGSPQISIVWVGLDGDEIVAGHLPEHRKVRNIRNDSRVALSIETDKRNAIGLNEYLVIYGTARITEGGAAELLQKLAHTYLDCADSRSFEHDRVYRERGAAVVLDKVCEETYCCPWAVPGRLPRCGSGSKVQRPVECRPRRIRSSARRGPPAPAAARRCPGDLPSGAADVRRIQP